MRIGMGFMSGELDLTYSVNLSITQRTATTVYSFVNYTILDVFNMSSPVQTNYTQDDFFPIFDKALSFDPTLLNDSYDQYFFTPFSEAGADLSNSTGLEFFSYLFNRRNTVNTQEGDLVLKQLLAVPV